MWYYFQYPNVSKLMDGIPLGSLWATGSSVLVGRITLRTRCSFPHLYYIYIYKETPTDLPKSNGGSSLDEMTMKSIGWFLRMRQFSMWYYFQYPNVSKLMDGIPLCSLWATGSSVLVGRITLRTRCSFPSLYYIYIYICKELPTDLPKSNKGQPWMKWQWNLLVGS